MFSCALSFFIAEKDKLNENGLHFFLQRQTILKDLSTPMEGYHSLSAWNTQPKMQPSFAPQHPTPSIHTLLPLPSSPPNAPRPRTNTFPLTQSGAAVGISGTLPIRATADPWQQGGGEVMELERLANTPKYQRVQCVLCEVALHSNEDIRKHLATQQHSEAILQHPEIRLQDILIPDSFVSEALRKGLNPSFESHQPTRQNPSVGTKRGLIWTSEQRNQQEDVNKINQTSFKISDSEFELAKRMKLDVTPVRPINPTKPPEVPSHQRSSTYPSQTHQRTSELGQRYAMERLDGNIHRYMYNPDWFKPDVPMHDFESKHPTGRSVARYETYDVGRTDSNSWRYDVGRSESNVSRYDSGRSESNVSRYDSGRADSNVSRYDSGRADSNISRYDSGWADGNVSRYDSGRADSTVSRYDSGRADSNVSRYDSGWADSTVSRYDSGRADSNVSRYDSGRADSTVSRYDSGRADSNVSRYDSGRADSNVSRYDSGRADSNISRYDSGRADSTVSRYDSGRADSNVSRYDSGRSESSSSISGRLGPSVARYNSRNSEVGWSCKPRLDTGPNSGSGFPRNEFEAVGSRQEPRKAEASSQQDSQVSFKFDVKETVFHCKVCDIAVPNQFHWEFHAKSAKHLENIRALEEAARGGEESVKLKEKQWENEGEWRKREQKQREMEIAEEERLKMLEEERRRAEEEKTRAEARERVHMEENLGQRWRRAMQEKDMAGMMLGGQPSNKAVDERVSKAEDPTPKVTSTNQQQASSAIVPSFKLEEVQPEFHCDICNFVVRNRNYWKSHINSPRHQMKVSGSPAQSKTTSSSQDLPFRCILCDICTNDESTFGQHMMGRRHRNNLKLSPALTKTQVTGTTKADKLPSAVAAAIVQPTLKLAQEGQGQNEASKPTSGSSAIKPQATLPATNIVKPLAHKPVAPLPTTSTQQQPSTSKVKESSPNATLPQTSDHEAKIGKPIRLKRPWRKSRDDDTGSAEASEPGERAAGRITQSANVQHSSQQRSSLASIQSPDRPTSITTTAHPSTTQQQSKRAAVLGQTQEEFSRPRMIPTGHVTRGNAVVKTSPQQRPQISPPYRHHSRSPLPTSSRSEVIMHTGSRTELDKRGPDYGTDKDYSLGESYDMREVRSYEMAENKERYRPEEFEGDSLEFEIHPDTPDFDQYQDSSLSFDHHETTSRYSSLPPHTTESRYGSDSSRLDFNPRPQAPVSSKPRGDPGPASSVYPRTSSAEFEQRRFVTSKWDSRPSPFQGPRDKFGSLIRPTSQTLSPLHASNTAPPAATVSRIFGSASGRQRSVQTINYHHGKGEPPQLSQRQAGSGFGAHTWPGEQHSLGAAEHETRSGIVHEKARVPSHDNHERPGPLAFPTRNEQDSRTWPWQHATERGIPRTGYMMDHEREQMFHPMDRNIDPSEGRRLWPFEHKLAATLSPMPEPNILLPPRREYGYAARSDFDIPRHLPF